MEVSCVRTYTTRGRSPHISKKSSLNIRHGKGRLQNFNRIIGQSCRTTSLNSDAQSELFTYNSTTTTVGCVRKHEQKCANFDHMVERPSLLSSMHITDRARRVDDSRDSSE